MLARVKGRVVHMVLSRVSPLAVPVLLEIGRESVRSDADEEKLLAEAEAIIAEATGEREPPPVKPIHRGNAMRRRPVQTSLFGS
jgi:ATP-dependent Lhr-like helicase